MFARSVSLHLKPNRVEEFTRIIENEVIPMIARTEGLPGQDRFGCLRWTGSDWPQHLG